MNVRTLLAMAALTVTTACGLATRSASPRVVVLGFDGLDFTLTQQLMAQGRLPHFSQLAATGAFAPLTTSHPPQSPVAWSTFITGLDPGGHGIFDFIHRDPKTMTPYLSTTRTIAPSRLMTIGKWQLPLSPGRVELLRAGEPFWEPLEARDFPATIVRMPANFPPSATATRELSGMGTPDILGTYGEFTLLTGDPAAATETFLSGGVIRKVVERDGVVSGVVEGPDQPYLRAPERTRLTLTIYPDSTRQYVKVVIDRETRVLRVGEWSTWIPVALPLTPLQHLPAQCRVFLKQLTPHLELYVSPLNIDPIAPAAPISTPAGYAAELARATGRFYTQGMPEDTKALKTGVLTTAEFLQQARLAMDETRRQFRHVVSRFDQGLLFYYFGGVDQVSHMLWRSLDPGHPAYDASADGPHADVIPALYVEMDAVVGEALARIGPSDLLIVMSDHGFASWRRAFNLNSWLRDQGYLTPAGRGRSSAGRVLGEVDLTRSRAYGLGLNGLYLNLAGREAAGTVDPASRDALLTEITAALLAVIDPRTGQPAISRVDRPDRLFASAQRADLTPDLIVGYAKGTRVSDDSALGMLSAEVFSDNTSAWSGDHCMDPGAVPGVLLTSRRLRTPAPALQSLAGAILAEIGIQGFPKGH